MSWYSLWRPYIQAEETLNDSDKTFTVPAGVEWEILWIWVEFTSTATGGNRQIVIEIQDVANDVVGQPARAGVVQAASLTRYYTFGQSLANMAAFIDTDYLTTAMHPIYLKESDQLRVYDNNAVDAAADDMILQVGIRARSVV